MKPDITFWSFDRGFKFGISWDVINGLGKTFVLLIHLGPFIYSMAWGLQTGGRCKLPYPCPPPPPRKVVGTNGHFEPLTPWPRK